MKDSNQKRVLIIPNKVELRNQVPEDSNEVDTSTDFWRWTHSGLKYKIDWKQLNFKSYLESILKLFIIYRLKNLSTATVSKGDITFLKKLSNRKLTFPFETLELLTFFESIKERSVPFTFRKFYEWAYTNEYEGVNELQLIRIREFKMKPLKPYQTVFLEQNYLDEKEVNLISKHLKGFKSFDNYIDLRNNIILHLAYELAPRRSQFYVLDKKDFVVFNSSSKSQNKYFSIDLPMAKKRRSKDIKRRKRSITKELGFKIERLFAFNHKNIFKNNAFFITEDDTRLTPLNIGNIIIKELNSIGINRMPTDLRHHLAQSLANQGASAEIIAEILGHNSTVPARAYIAATPKIAEIKAAALGKNKKYNEIINMISTGKIIQKNKATNKERWVKGMVGNQFIGGIGSCGLPNDTSCPKNPVYACYTCLKFHPFKNGNHEKVKNGLQNQAQFHIDIAEKGLDIEHNRPVTQLEETIAAVDHVLIRIKKESDGK